MNRNGIRRDATFLYVASSNCGVTADDIGLFSPVVGFCPASCTALGRDSTLGDQILLSHHHRVVARHYIRPLALRWQCSSPDVELTYLPYECSATQSLANHPAGAMLTP